MAKRLAPASPPATLDDTDRALLAALAEDARQPVSELARQVGAQYCRASTAARDPRRHRTLHRANRSACARLHAAGNRAREAVAGAIASGRRGDPAYPGVRGMRQGDGRRLLCLPSVPSFDRAARRHPVEGDGARGNQHRHHQVDAGRAQAAAVRLSASKPLLLHGFEEGQHLRDQFRGCFLGDVVPTRQRPPADIARHPTPFRERLETLLDHALLAPQHA